MQQFMHCGRDEVVLTATDGIAEGPGYSEIHIDESVSHRTVGVHTGEDLVLHDRVEETGTGAGEITAR